MKTFRVEHKTMSLLDNSGNRKYNTIVVTLHSPPYKKENILNKTNWKSKDVTITEVSQEEIE